LRQTLSDLTGSVAYNGVLIGVVGRVAVEDGSAEGAFF
jgi:hypothetical protein